MLNLSNPFHAASGAVNVNSSGSNAPFSNLNLNQLNLNAQITAANAHHTHAQQATAKDLLGHAAVAAAGANAAFSMPLNINQLAMHNIPNAANANANANAVHTHQQTQPSHAMNINAMNMNAMQMSHQQQAGQAHAQAHAHAQALALAHQQQQQQVHMNNSVHINQMQQQQQQQQQFHQQPPTHQQPQHTPANPDGANVEVKDPETLSYYPAFVDDINSTKGEMLIRYPNDWKTPEWIVCADVRPAPPEGLPFDPMPGQVIEAQAKSSETVPFSWWRATVKSRKGDFFVVAFNSFEAEITEVLEKDLLRPVNVAPHFQAREIQREEIVLPKQLHGAVDAANFSQVRAQSNALAIRVQHKQSPATASSSASTPNTVVSSSLVIVGNLSSCKLASILSQMHINHLVGIVSRQQRTEARQRELAHLQQQIQAGVQEEFSIPLRLMGLAIGKKGKNVQNAHSVPGVRAIRTDKDSGRILIIGDDKTACQEARALLEFVEERYSISREKVGRIVGKSFVNIQDIVEKSEVVRIVVDDDEAANPTTNTNANKSEKKTAQSELVDLVITGARSKVEVAKLLLDFHIRYLENVNELTLKEHELDEQYVRLKRELGTQQQKKEQKEKHREERGGRAPRDRSEQGDAAKHKRIPLRLQRPQSAQTPHAAAKVIDVRDRKPQDSDYKTAVNSANVATGSTAPASSSALPSSVSSAAAAGLSGFPPSNGSDGRRPRPVTAVPTKATKSARGERQIAKANEQIVASQASTTISGQSAASAVSTESRDAYPRGSSRSDRRPKKVEYRPVSHAAEGSGPAANASAPTSNQLSTESSASAKKAPRYRRKDGAAEETKDDVTDGVDGAGVADKEKDKRYQERRDRRQAKERERERDSEEKEKQDVPYEKKLKFRPKAKPAEVLPSNGSETASTANLSYTNSNLKDPVENIVSSSAAVDTPNN